MTDQPVHPAAASAAPAEAALCSVHGLVKHYGGVHALKGVSLDFHGGQVHAILGENGAGKSTLMKILAGAERPDEGRISLEGEDRDFRNGADANAAGIAIVFQELSLYPDVTVLANLFAQREPRRFGMVRPAEMRRLAKPVLEEIGLDVDLETRLETLTLDERQLVEIAKALLVSPRLLILDEPTSALTTRETERLFTVVRRLRARGVAILFVSHRLEEIFAISDTISVLRDGQHVVTVAPGETSMDEIVAHMIGRRPSELPSRPARTHHEGGTLRVDGVSTGRVLREVSFDVEPGEVVGVAGLEDAGIAPLFHTIFGARRADAGSITLPNGKLVRGNATAAVKSGVAYVPSDRRQAGLMLEQSITDNVSGVTAGVIGTLGPFPSKRAMRAAAEHERTRLSIRTSSVSAAAGRLSGGNQQKVVLAKWLQTEPGVVLLDDPTRGVDIGAKLEIYEIVRRLAESGCAVLFYSSELAEYELTCQRVIVMRRGRVVTELVGDQVEEHALLRAINLDAPAPAAAVAPAS